MRLEACATAVLEDDDVEPQRCPPSRVPIIVSATPKNLSMSLPTSNDDGSPSSDFEAAFESVQGSYCKVDRINVSPPDIRTKLAMIEREFKYARKAATLAEVSQRAQEALANIQDLGVLRSAGVELVSGDMVGSLLCACMFSVVS